MNTPAPPSTALDATGNLGTTERWLSLLGGFGLLLSAARGSPLGRLARTGAALPLLARGAAGYCAVKAAITGETSVGEGLQEQWRRLAGGVGAVWSERTDARHIDSMDALYESELQELASAETQLCDLAHELAEAIQNPALATRLSEYATELEARRTDVESRLARLGVAPTEQADDAIRALIKETGKMTHVYAQKVRDAAIVASLQRIIHYKIAGYGTIASYAKALGQHEDAAYFHQLAERDKGVDTQLSELAKKTLNPEAVVAPQEQPAAQTRPH